MTKALYRSSEMKKWHVTFEVSCRVPPDIVQRVLALNAEHVNMATPGCGLILADDAELGRYLVIEEGADGRVVDHIVSRERGHALVERLRALIRRHPERAVDPAPPEEPSLLGAACAVADAWATGHDAEPMADDLVAALNRLERTTRSSPLRSVRRPRIACPAALVALLDEYGLESDLVDDDGTPISADDLCSRFRSVDADEATIGRVAELYESVSSQLLKVKPCP